MSSDRNVFCGILAKEFQSMAGIRPPDQWKGCYRLLRVTVKLPRSVDKTKACVVCVKCLYKVVYSI